jgi:mannose-6-phosphate isomerase-like protein (cupin superfamily)
MHKQGKVWGWTMEVFRRNNVLVNRIETIPKRFCSKHHHQHKFNMFFVERGKLLVRVWGDKLVDDTILGPLESCVVPPGVWHQFRVIEPDTVAYEFYWQEMIGEDIVRATVGGIEE